MNIDDVKAGVAQIRAVSADCERAHGMEDGLRDRFIRHVAATASPELARMAKEVLKSSDINFSRWCA